MVKKSGNYALPLFLVLLLSGMAACSNDEADGNSTDENGDSAENGGEVVELEFWRSSEPGRPDYELFMERLQQFDDEHPEIDLTITTTPHADYRTRLNTQAAGGQLPDMFQVWPGAELEPLVESEAVLSISSIKDYWTDNLLPEEAFNDFTFDNEVYAVPANLNPTHFIYYDTDMLEEAGYDAFPGTYDEFLQLIDDLNARDITPIALGNSDRWVLQSVYISTIADRFTGSDFLQQVFDGERAFTDDDFVDALGVIEELTQMEAFNDDLNTIDSGQMIDYFLQGRSAMVMDGNWGVTSILENKPDDKNIGIATIPLGESDSISSVMGTATAINSELEGEKREAAETLLTWLYDEPLFEGFLSIGRPTIANVELPEDADLDPLFEDMYELAQNADIAPVYDATLPQAVNNTLENELQAITIGAATAEEAAQSIQNSLENQ